ncbi:hypothetical protein HOF92_09510 [bacterium]|nr:hypothetical protein [bacterium]
MERLSGEGVCTEHFNDDALGSDLSPFFYYPKV